MALSWCGSAYAEPMVRLYPYLAHQVGTTAYVRAGLIVIGDDSWTSITVGGGYTLTCGVQTVYAENSSVMPFTPGPTQAIVYVPPVQPADYNVGGFSTLAWGDCRHCSFQYRGRLLEGVATINATTYGAGFVFTVGGVEMVKGDTHTFDVCKPTLSGSSSSGCRQ